MLAPRVLTQDSFNPTGVFINLEDAIFGSGTTSTDIQFISAK